MGLRQAPLLVSRMQPATRRVLVHDCVLAREFMQVFKHCGPVPAAMDHPDTVRAGAPLISRVLEMRLLDSCVCLAQDGLAEVAQAVRDVVGCAGAICEISDPDDVEAMQLVEHGKDEWPLRRPEIGEPVRRELRAPLFVIEEGEVVLRTVQRHANIRHVQRQLCRIIASLVC